MPRGIPRKGGRRRGPGRPPGSAGGMSGVVASLRSYRSSLVSSRDDLDARIAALDTAMSAMGASPAVGRPRGGAGRPGPTAGRSSAGYTPRRGSLKEFVLKVLSTGGIMAVKDVTKGVTKAGYKSDNKTLAKSVGLALSELPNVKKVGRGKFRLK